MARPTFDRYQWKLLVFLSVATFFEGYDFIALSQVLPNLRQDFGLSKGEGGAMYGLINVGTIVAFVLIRLADRWGRRRVLSLTIAGYTLCTFLSGFAPEPVTFTAAQLVARTFLIAEYGISMVYAAEEFPAAQRGLVIGLVQGAASLGGIVCAGVAPALLATSYGWRTVYFVGIIPLILVAYLRRNIRESKRFASRPAGAGERRSWAAVMRGPYRKRILQLGLIFGLTYACTNTVIAFWKDFAVNERFLTDGQVGTAISIAAAGSMPLILFAGRLLDLVGRRRGAAIIFLVSAAGTFLGYTLEGQWPLTAALVFGIFGVSATMSVLNAYGTELFPNEIRANAFGWASNVLGRIAYVASPFVVGWVAEYTDWGPAVAATAALLVLALVFILVLLPETRAKELEESAELARPTR